MHSACSDHGSLCATFSTSRYWTVCIYGAYGIPIGVPWPRAWRSPFGKGFAFRSLAPVGAKQIIVVFVDPRTWNWCMLYVTMFIISNYFCHVFIYVIIVSPQRGLEPMSFKWLVTCLDKCAAACMFGPDVRHVTWHALMRLCRAKSDMSHCIDKRASWWALWSP